MNRRGSVERRSTLSGPRAAVCAGAALLAPVSLATGAGPNLGAPVPIHTFTMDADPGWSTEGMWAWGQPTGEGGTQFGNPDPTEGATGLNVYGYNLDGDFPIDIGGPYWLTTTALDCTGATQVTLQFERWLNCDWLPWVSVSIEVSNDGATWVRIWENAHEEIADDAWATHAYDISAVADDQATVYVRWGHEVLTSGTWAYSGWNIDDIVILGVAQGAVCPWDTTPVGAPDGAVGLGDLNALLSNWGDCPAPPEDCPCDFTLPPDGMVGLGDLNALLSNWGPCP
jgi:hypothetical protein